MSGTFWTRFASCLLLEYLFGRFCSVRCHSMLCYVRVAGAPPACAKRRSTLYLLPHAVGLFRGTVSMRLCCSEAQSRFPSFSLSKEAIPPCPNPDSPLCRLTTRISKSGQDKMIVTLVKKDAVTWYDLTSTNSR